MTDLIARLEELEKQATPGPWAYVLDGQGWPLLVAGDDVIFSPQGANNEPRPDADSAFAMKGEQPSNSATTSPPSSMPSSRHCRLSYRSSGAW